jgi:phthalate 4,5-dioxygenase
MRWLDDLIAPTPFTHARTAAGTGIIERRYTRENDYGIDRAVQRGVTYSGVAEFMSQDFMVTETMGPIYDRTQEHLGTSDKAIIRMRRLLIAAAKRVAEGGDAPAIDGDLDYRGIRSAEKILEAGEDWRVLGTDDDELVRETDPPLITDR